MVSDFFFKRLCSQGFYTLFSAVFLDLFAWLFSFFLDTIFHSLLLLRILFSDYDIGQSNFISRPVLFSADVPYNLINNQTFQISWLFLFYNYYNVVSKMLSHVTVCLQTKKAGNNWWKVRGKYWIVLFDVVQGCQIFRPHWRLLIHFMDFKLPKQACEHLSIFSTY